MSKIIINKPINLNLPNVYILYTGGTIGMLPTASNSLIPVKGNLTKLINQLNISYRLNINYQLERLTPLIDSSNLQTINWKYMLEKLDKNYHKYDSFIVIHGTDTLAYTASALSFFLRTWKKTLIITGSQIPLSVINNDAEKNIIDSILVSLCKIPGVYIVFGGKILQGNRTTKYSSTDLQAYKSPNYPSIGKIVTINNNKHIKINHNLLASIIPNKQILKLNKLANAWNVTKWKSNLKIYIFTILPDNNSPPLKAIIDLNPNAIIIRSYGIGNAPVIDKEFLKTLKRAISRNILIINSSQCLAGRINMKTYHTGEQLREMGVINSYDMTLEAIYTKLFYLLEMMGTNSKLLKTLFNVNLIGEITL